jgi:hypothetical protein
MYIKCTKSRPPLSTKVKAKLIFVSFLADEI